MSDVTTLYTYAGEILDVASDAVAVTFGGAIDRAFVSTTRPALDCCPQLTVDLRSLNVEVTSPNVPAPAAGQRIRLRVVFVAGFVVTVVRCSADADLQGPSTAGIAEVARQTSEDLWAVWNALKQSWNAGGFLDGNCKGFYMDPPVPVQQEGGCVGWEIPLRVWVGGFDPLP